MKPSRGLQYPQVAFLSVEILPLFDSRDALLSSPLSLPFVRGKVPEKTRGPNAGRHKSRS